MTEPPQPNLDRDGFAILPGVLPPDRVREIVHLEFAAAGPLPDSCQWYDFRPLAGERSGESIASVDSLPVA
jgi:hypothetical protein